MKAIERLYQYFENKNIKPTRFEKNFDISNGYFGTQLKRSADIGSGILEIIINNCRDLNIEWLITGEGEMLKDGSQPTHKADQKGVELLLEHLKAEIKELKAENRALYLQIDRLQGQLKL